MSLSRFSLRTLAIVVTLFCAYFAAWEATKIHAGHNPESSSSIGIRRSYSPLPLVICREMTIENVSGFRRRDYYLWLFGPVVDVKADERHFFGGTLLVFSGYFVLEWLSRRRNASA
jgi:hypothetical protein